MKNLEKYLENILKNVIAILKNENILKKMKNITVILMLLPLLILLISIISIFGIGILGIYSISVILTMSYLAISQHQDILINITNTETALISQGINASFYTYVLFTQWMNIITRIIVQDIIKDLTNTIIYGIIFIILIIIYFLFLHKASKT